LVGKDIKLKIEGILNVEIASIRKKIGVSDEILTHDPL